MENWSCPADVLRHEWPRAQNLRDFAVSCALAYEATKAGLSEGWRCEWEPNVTLRKIRDARDVIMSALLLNYDKLRTYDLDGRSCRWNGVSVAFLLLCNLRRLALCISDDRVELTREEATELAESRALTSLKPSASLTQVEMYEALYCLSFRWNELEPSPALWKHVSLLEDRTVFLVTSVLPRSEIDGRTDWVRDVSNDARAASHEYVSDVATMLVLFAKSKRACRIVNDLATEKGSSKWRIVRARGKAGPYVLEETKLGYRKWLEREAASGRDTGSSKKIKETVSVLALFPGDRERYEREYQGRSTNDVATIMEVSRPSLEVSWWTTKLGKGDPMALFSEASSGKFASNVAVLKHFHMFMHAKYDFQWWINAVLVERSLLNDGKFEAATRRRPPSIVQIMGTFLVFYAPKKRIYVSDQAEIAIVLWCYIVAVLLKGKFSLISTSKDLPCLKELLEEWKDGGRDPERAREKPKRLEVVRNAVEITD